MSCPLLSATVPGTNGGVGARSAAAGAAAARATAASTTHSARLKGGSRNVHLHDVVVKMSTS
jgi:hypothetical protein